MDVCSPHGVQMTIEAWNEPVVLRMKTEGVDERHEYYHLTYYLPHSFSFDINHVCMPHISAPNHLLFIESF